MSVICIAEDRLSEIIPAKLLLLSLARHCPDVPVVIFFPPATPEFEIWLERFPQVTLRKTKFHGIAEWNVKPYVLEVLLKEGNAQVWWLDTDIILTSDFRQHFNSFSPDTLLFGQQPYLGDYQNGGKRAEGWGFQVARILPFEINGGVIRVHSSHLPFLKKWQELTESELYKQAQRQPFYSRAVHVQCDQDLITALLESKEFSHIPVEFVRRGKDIIQYAVPNGYSLMERLEDLGSGLPPLIHSLGLKPWTPADARLKQKRGFDLYYSSLFLEISPYNYVALQYKDEIDENLPWIKYSAAGHCFRTLGLGNPALMGLPLVAIYSFFLFLKTFLKRNTPQLIALLKPQRD